MSTWKPEGPKPVDVDPRRVSDFLDAATRRLGAPGSNVTMRVFSRWPDLVGPDIAAHSRPVSLHDGTLVLAVDHPAWATQLRFMTADLLTRIAEVTGGSEVVEIQVRVAPENGGQMARKRRF